jgi:hypothetical protein
MESTSTYWKGAFYCPVVSWSQMSPLP